MQYIWSLLITHISGVFSLFSWPFSYFSKVDLSIIHGFISVVWIAAFYFHLVHYLDESLCKKIPIIIWCNPWDNGNCMEFSTNESCKFCWAETCVEAIVFSKITESTALTLGRKNVMKNFCKKTRKLTNLMSYGTCQLQVKIHFFHVYLFIMRKRTNHWNAV